MRGARQPSPTPHLTTRDTTARDILATFGPATFGAAFFESVLDNGSLSNGAPAKVAKSTFEAANKPPLADTTPPNPRPPVDTTPSAIITSPHVTSNGHSLESPESGRKDMPPPGHTDTPPPGVTPKRRASNGGGNSVANAVAIAVGGQPLGALASVGSHSGGSQNNHAANNNHHQSNNNNHANKSVQPGGNSEANRAGGGGGGGEGRAGEGRRSASSRDFSGVRSGPNHDYARSGSNHEAREPERAGKAADMLMMLQGVEIPKVSVFISHKVFWQKSTPPHVCQLILHNYSCKE